MQKMFSNSYLALTVCAISLFLRGAAGAVTVTPTAASISEGSTVGQAVVTVKAAGGVAPYSYSTTATKFSVDSTTGVVTVKLALDATTDATSNVAITAIDSTPTTALTGSVTLVVTVTAEANTAPTFAAASFCASVSSTAKAGTPVGNYSATDSDKAAHNKQLTYSVKAGAGSTNFDISSAGLLTEAAGVTFDKATTPSYTLVLLVVDGGKAPLTASTTVTVKLDDKCSSASRLVGSTVTMATVVIWCLISFM